MRMLRLPGLMVDVSSVVAIERFDDDVTLIHAEYKSTPPVSAWPLFTSSSSIHRVHRVQLSFAETQAAYDAALEERKNG